MMLLLSHSVFGARQDPMGTPEYLAGDDSFPLYYAGCNGRFFGSRACGLGRADVGRHQFAGLRNHGTAAAAVEIAPTIVRTGRLLLTVGGAGGVRAGVVGDRGLSTITSSLTAAGVEVEVTWGASHGGLGKYKTGAVGLLLELEPGAVVYAFSM
jgi:hypothetical protein